MKSKQQLGLAALLALVLAFIVITNASLVARGEKQELKKAVFYVA